MCLSEPVCVSVCVEQEKLLVKARDDTDVQIVRHAWVLVRTTNRTISQLVPSNVSLRIT